jgi:hypothetical protein
MFAGHFTQTLTFSVFSYSFLLYIYGFYSCPIVSYGMQSSWNGLRKHDSVLLNFHLCPGDRALQSIKRWLWIVQQSMMANL